MSRMKKGNGLLRFLISAVFFALVLSGCNGTRKYEAVDLSSETAAAESESGSGEEQGTENSDEADLQALGNPAGEMMSADQAAESSQDAESVSESEEMASEMSEEESVAAARESAAEAYTAAANDDAETAPEVPFKRTYRRDRCGTPGESQYFQGVDWPVLFDDEGEDAGRLGWNGERRP